MALLDGYQRKRLIQLWEEERNNDDNYVYASVSKRAKHEGINVTRQAVRYLIKRFNEGGTMETRQARFRLLFGEGSTGQEREDQSGGESSLNNSSMKKDLYKSPGPQSTSPGSVSQNETTATVILATKLDLVSNDVTTMKVEILALKETVRDLQTKFNTLIAKLALAQNLHVAKETLQHVSTGSTQNAETETSIVDHLQQSEAAEEMTLEHHQHQSTATGLTGATIEASSDDPVNEVQLTTSGEPHGSSYQQQEFNADAAAVLAGLHSSGTSSYGMTQGGHPVVSNVESVITTETSGKHAIPREVLEAALDECRSRTSMATSLVRLLFTPEERLTSNCRGVGKNQLDPQRIAAIMDTCMAVFPPQADETPKAVRCKIRTAIDSSNRALRIKHRRAVDPKSHISELQLPSEEQVIEMTTSESPQPQTTIVDTTAQMDFALPVSGP